MKKVSFFALIVLFITFSLPTFAEDAYDYDDSYQEKFIEKFIVEIQIKEDSSVNVTEKILYNFIDIESHGIYRNIPMVYGDHGEVSAIVTVNSITDENGEPYEYEEWDYYQKELKIGSADFTITGPHWYVINYDFFPAVNGFENHDELYWNVTGNDWSETINYAEATVTLSTDIPNATLASTCFTGYFGEEESSCVSEIISDNEFKFATTEPIGSYNGFTIVAGFEKGIVTPPTYLEISSEPYDAEIYIDDEYMGTTPIRIPETIGAHELELKKFKYKSLTKSITIYEGQENSFHFNLEQNWWVPIVEFYIPMFLLVLGIWVCYMLYRKYGKEPEGRGIIAPQVTPPDKLSPSEVGVIVDQKAHLHDISAAIINLAVKGYLKIKREEGKGIFSKKDKFSFINVKSIKDNDKNVENFERTIFKEIFKSGKKEVKLSDLNNKFYKKLKIIKKELYQKVIDKKYFAKNPDKVRGNYYLVGFVMLFAGNAFGIVAAIFLWSPLYLLINPVISIIIIVMAYWMSKRTKKGALAYEHILGLKMYLKTAEKDRFKKLHSPKNFREHFEKLLPYAIALEVEKEWAEKFEGMFKTPPDWYVNDTFTLSALASSMSSFSKQSTTAFAARPSSSGGSYGSGWSGGSWSGGSGFSGGFSGGGFGGGGGGSW
ncbi:DUF2207 family protein [Patescibacteria group bacterium]